MDAQSKDYLSQICVFKRRRTQEQMSKRRKLAKHSLYVALPHSSVPLINYRPTVTELSKEQLEIIKMDAHTVVAKIKAGELTAAAVMEATLLQASRAHEKCTIFVINFAEEALRQANELDETCVQ